MKITGEATKEKTVVFQSQKLTLAQREFDSFDPEESEVDFILSLPFNEVLNYKGYEKDMNQYVLQELLDLSVLLRIAKKEDLAEKEEYMWWQKV